jgi:hypothetical protein
MRLLGIDMRRSELFVLGTLIKGFPPCVSEKDCLTVKKKSCFAFYL